MKSFICKGIIVLFIVAFVDILFGAVYKPIIKNLPNSGLSQTDSYYALNRGTADVIILGASNAKRGYNPEVFNEYGFSSVYNAALDGNEMLYHLAVLKSIMARKVPKIVILDINNKCIDGSWKNRLVNHKHLYRENTYVRSILTENDVDSFIKLKSLLSFYIYNNTLTWVARAYMIGDQSKDMHGFDPLEGTKGNLVLEKSNWDGEVNGRELIAFHQMIDLCKSNGVKLYICISPTFQKSDTDFSSFIRKEIMGEATRLIDYSNNACFLNHKEYFFDVLHLNISGANVFSQQIAEIISE